MGEAPTAGTLSGERRAEILEIASKLRVTDVRDGLDWMGLHAVGTVSPEIRPLFRTHACGFARTVRHTPTQRTVPTMSPAQYTDWAYRYWYGEVMRSDLFDTLLPTSLSWTPAGPTLLRSGLVTP